MRTRVFTDLLFAILLLPFIAFSALAAVSETDTVKGMRSFTVEFKSGLFSVQAKEAPLGDVLAEIEKRSGFVISIDEELKTRPITLSFPGQNITRTMEAITNAAGLAGYGISYKSWNTPGKIGQWVIDKIALADKGGERTTQQKIIPPDNQRVEKKTIKASAATKKSKIIEKEPFFDKRLNRYVEVAKGEVFVKFPKGVTKEQIEKFHKEKGTQAIKDYEKVNAARLKIPATESVSEFIEKHSIDGKQAYIEPVFLATQQAVQVNDPSFMYQWAIPQIQADKAWEINNGSPDVIIAVIDTGIDIVHPDLKNKVVQGIDIVNGGSSGLDDNGHGTHVAGIIAAESNNSIGIAGISWKSKLMSVKVITASGDGTYSDLIEGIIYAVDHGARVLNLSLGGYSYSQILGDAIEYAHSSRAVIVAAGGNENTNEPLYPAAYPNVIGVSATDPSDLRWSSSNYGGYIKLSAPGVGVLSTQKNNGYGEATGTSASTAHVSGVAVLILSKNPDFSNTQVENILYQTADDFGDKGWDNYYGFGRVNALKAIEKAGIEVHDVAVTGIRIEPETFKVGEATKIIVTVENQGTFVESGLTVSAAVNDAPVEGLKTIASIKAGESVDVGFVWVPISETNAMIGIASQVSAVTGELDLNDNLKKISLNYAYNTEDRVVTLYSIVPPVHQWIALQAYNKLNPDSDAALKNEMKGYLPPDDGSTQLYTSGFWSGFSYNDLFLKYGGASEPSSPSIALIEGTFEEDLDVLKHGCRLDHYINFDIHDLDSHYWDLKENKGLGSCPGALEDATRDDIDGGLPGRFQRAVKAYRDDHQLDKAYYWLGRTAHLLMDMSVPSHTLLDAHAILPDSGILNDYKADAYENYTGIHYTEVTSTSPNTEIPDISAKNFSLPDNDIYKNIPTTDGRLGVAKLFYNLAQISNDFDSADKPGEGFSSFSTGNGNSNYYPAKNDLSSNKVVKTVKLISSWGTVKKTLVLGTDYEINDDDNRIYYHKSFYNSIDQTDYIDVVYSDGPDDFFKDLDTNLLNLGHGYDGIIPSSVSKRNQEELQSRAIAYVAALYQLFWNETHLGNGDPADSAKFNDATIKQLFINEYNNNSGASKIGYPINFVHKWGNYWVQDFRPMKDGNGNDLGGFGSAIMIYNPEKYEVYTVHGDIWKQVYEVMDGPGSWLGPPVSDETTHPTYGTIQYFKNGYITHKDDGGNWWEAYPNDTSPTVYILSVSKTGTGTVTSNPSGISCGSTCSANYTSGTSVILTAIASSGYAFSGWGGACSGTGSCTVTMSSDKSITATFTVSTSGGTVPTVTSSTASSIASTGANLNATIASDGSSAVLERRFSWGTTPSCADGWVTDDLASANHGNIITSGNAFSFNLAGLQPNTTYYFRAWAKNSSTEISCGSVPGWGCGAVPVSFTSTSAAPDTTLDTTAPTGSIIINSNAASTNSTAVTLTLLATDDSGTVAQMRFSNDNATWSAWEAYSTSKTWALTTGNATKTVYAQFKDAAGNVSVVYNDTITLNVITTAPTGSIRVSIVPQAAADAGAQWRLVGETAWRNSGTDVSGLAYGSYNAEFSAVVGWTTPANQSVPISIVIPDTWVNSGSYVQTQQVTINAPSNLQATADANGGIVLSWMDNSTNEIGFKLERKLGTAGSFSHRYNADPNTTSFTDTLATLGVVSCFRIAAIDLYGAFSGYSNEACAVPQIATPASGITYTVTPLASTGGSISPSTPQTVNSGATTTFTVTPNTGYVISSVTGCGGTLVGNTYTTAAITADCTVTATFAVYTAPGVITTIAGNGTGGFSGDGGQATSASLDNPYGVAVDSIGNVYIADSINNRIRKVGTDGVITTVAGTGTYGFSGDKGQATSAKLQYPTGVTIDSIGNVYISDMNNNRIRKVGTDSVITTVAGNGTAGYFGDSGQATAARLNKPYGVAVDSIGNVYIADTFNHRIRKVATDGVITTVAGDGTAGFSGDNGQATFAQLQDPGGVAVDSVGNVYIADQNNHRVRKVGTNGVITTVAGDGTAGFSGDNGQATSASLRHPTSVAVDSVGNINISDSGNVRIRKVQGASPTACYDPMVPLTVGATAMSDSICQGYYQQYSFPITSGKLYKVTITPSSGNSDLYLHGISSVSDSTYTYSSMNGSTSVDSYAFTASSNGTYYAAVYGYTSGTSSYTVKVEDVTSTAVTYTVTPLASTGGGISPSTPQTVNSGASASFTVTPNTGYFPSSITGCSGTLGGNTYTTGAITGDCTVTAAFAVIPKPTGVSASAGNGQAIISWSNNSIETQLMELDCLRYGISGCSVSYNIYWSTSSGVSKTSGTKISNAMMPYTHTGLTNGMQYYYVVTAVNSYGESAESTQVSATPTTHPADGTLSATALNTVVDLSWFGFSDSGSGIIGYKLVYDTAGAPASCAGTPLYTGVDTSYSHTKLTNGVSYGYRVCAIDNAGNTSSGITATAIPVAPDRLSMPLDDSGTLGVEREDGGSDANNIDSATSKPRLDIAFNFGITLMDSSGNAPQYVRLYITNRSNPGAADYYPIDLTCDTNWAYGAYCSYPTLLGPAANHKYYFEAKLADGMVLRYPATGEIAGPTVELLNGQNMVGAPRDLATAGLDGSAAFGNAQTYKWVSEGITTDGNKGHYVLVDSSNPVKPGEGYFTVRNGVSATLPELELYNDVLDTTYAVTLKPGWNMLSNPYGGPVKLSAVHVKKGSEDPVAWADAATNGWVVNAIYFYKGSDWGSAYAFESAGGSPDATLVPWMGYWVYLNKNDGVYSLVIPRP